MFVLPALNVCFGNYDVNYVISIEAG